MKKSDQKPIEILLTDIQLHSNKNNNPQSFKRKIEKSIKNKKSGRCYGGIKMEKNGKLRFEIELPEEISGRDVIFKINQSSLPIFLGKDSIEKIKSINKNKII